MQLAGRASKIVIAECDRTVLELLQVRLHVAGYHPIAVRDGLGAMEVLRNIRPDAVLLELNLPDVDGFEVRRALNGQPERLPAPVLVMGRSLSAEDIRRAIGLGARDCLTKPFSGADALDRLSRMLKRQAQVPAPVAVPARPVAYC